MKPPRVTKKHFPKSWKKWRKLKEGEFLRYTDRVALNTITKGNTWYRHLHTEQMGRWCGAVVRNASQGTMPEGYYYRRVT